MSQFKLLRKVENLDDGTAEYVAQHERHYPYIHQGFVDADWPRATAYSDAIRDATVGYAIADESGAIVREFATLEAANSARAGARTVLAVEVEVPDEEPVVADKK